MSSVLSSCLLETAAASVSQTTILGPVVSGSRVKIDKYTVYNSTAAVATYTVNIVASGGTAAASNIKGIASIQPGETYTMPWVVGHDLNAGAFVSVIASVAGLNHRITGRTTTS